MTYRVTGVTLAPPIGHLQPVAEFDVRVVAVDESAAREAVHAVARAAGNSAFVEDIVAIEVAA